MHNEGKAVITSPKVLSFFSVLILIFHACANVYHARASFMPITILVKLQGTRYRLPLISSSLSLRAYDPSLGFFAPFFAACSCLCFLFFSAAFSSFFFLISASSSAVLGTGLKKSFMRAISRVSITNLPCMCKEG